jgi:hypothetical protein
MRTLIVNLPESLLTDLVMRVNETVLVFFKFGASIYEV